MNSVNRPFDLVILDLDGTILDPYKSADFTPAVMEAVAAVQASGIPVTIGTGRTFDFVRHYAKILNVTMPVVTTQGAVVGNPVTGEVLAESILPLDASRAVAEWVDESERITVFYFTQADGSVTIYQNRNEGNDEFYDHVFGTPRVMQQSFRDLLAADNAHPPVKFITVDNPEAGDDIDPTLQARFSQNLYITRTHPKLVEGTALGVNKGEGVRKLCQILGIDRSRVLAIGDSNNDIPMLEAVGTAVAMGNAGEPVRAVADWIAPSIDDDGAAVALHKFILERMRL